MGLVGNSVFADERAVEFRVVSDHLPCDLHRRSRLLGRDIPNEFSDGFLHAFNGFRSHLVPGGQVDRHVSTSRSGRALVGNPHVGLLLGCTGGVVSSEDSETVVYSTVDTGQDPSSG